MSKDCGCKKEIHNAVPEYRHAIPAMNWMMPFHPLFVPNQPPPLPMPCGCCAPLPLPPHPGPIDYIPSKLYPDFWSDAHWMVPMHYHAWWHGPFAPLFPPPPPPKPVPPVKPEKGCIPKIYRHESIELTEGANISIQSIETTAGKTSYIISAPVMTGATAFTNGKSGTVPTPTVYDFDKFLSGDGTYRTPSFTIVVDSDSIKGSGTSEDPLYVDEMVGATLTAAGESGLVPAPAAGDQAKFLRGDKTWAYSGTTVNKVDASAMSGDASFAVTEPNTFTDVGTIPAEVTSLTIALPKSGTLLATEFIEMKVSNTDMVLTCKIDDTVCKTTGIPSKWNTEATYQITVINDCASVTEYI